MSSNLSTSSFPLWIFHNKYDDDDEYFYSIYKVGKNSYMSESLNYKGMSVGKIAPKSFYTRRELIEMFFDDEDRFELVHYNPEQTMNKMKEFYDIYIKERDRLVSEGWSIDDSELFTYPDIDEAYPNEEEEEIIRRRLRLLANLPQPSEEEEEEEKDEDPSSDESEDPTSD